MATVYKAKCHVLKRFVAVKVLREEFTTDAEFIKRFNIEAQSAASLTHPNIVSVYDVGSEENLYYIVMELVQGKTLKEIILEDGALPWKWSTNIAIQIASALDMAHKNNIIHRDIKPHNIIITEDGIAKVTDFGIAKAVSNSTITAFGTTIGSVHYFSPEHARGGYTDAKSDLYSLGVVLYEMVTGKVPFDADTPVSVALKHMQEEAIAPIKLNPAIPKGLNDIIIKAMKKDINERYTTASEMLKDLNSVLKNPNGDTVIMKKINSDFPTQKIPLMYEKPLHEKIETKQKEFSKRKKENKLIKFLKEHTVAKIAVIILSCILLFALAMGITYAIVSAGKPKDVQLPQTVGITLEEAKQIVTDSNLKIEVLEEKYSSEVEAGKIISQDPKYRENYKIKEGNIIKVVISKGTEVAVVPNVVATTKDEARITLKQQGFEIEEIEEKSDKIEAGYIIKQEPLEGAEVEAKSTVKIFVSIGTGIEQVVVPEVLGKSKEEATQILTNAKLTVATVKTETDTTKEDGKIIKQSIEPGKTVDENTAVTLTINSIPKISTGTVNINVKSFTGYVAKKDESGKVIPPDKVEVMLKVAPLGGTEDVVYKKEHSEDLEKLTVSVQGIGTITVKTYISGVLKSTNQLNLNDATPVLNVSK